VSNAVAEPAGTEPMEKLWIVWEELRWTATGDARGVADDPALEEAQGSRRDAREEAWAARRPCGKEMRAWPPSRWPRVDGEPRQRHYGLAPVGRSGGSTVASRRWEEAGAGTEKRR
jgi:hypothetical protein